MSRMITPILHTLRLYNVLFFKYFEVFEKRQDANCLFFSELNGKWKQMLVF